VLVSEVKEDSPAAKAGLKAGDVITAMDGQKIEDVSALMQATSKKEEGSVTLTIVRNRSEQTLTLTLEKPERRSFQTPRTRARLLTRGVSVSF
jgi:S1-C subfamily serine protease